LDRGRKPGCSKGSTMSLVGSLQSGGRIRGCAVRVSPRGGRFIRRTPSCSAEPTSAILTSGPTLSPDGEAFERPHVRRRGGRRARRRPPRAANATAGAPTTANLTVPRMMTGAQISKKGYAWKHLLGGEFRLAERREEDDQPSTTKTTHMSALKTTTWSPEKVYYS
jgi:hypothetical protein